jgi:hypothetical protein
MSNLLNGWFADRGPGRGKPVYSTGTTIVPANGLVGKGVTSAPVAGLFVPVVPPLVTKSLLGGWFCDRAPGVGKPLSAGPTNGIIGGGVPLNSVATIDQYENELSPPTGITDVTFAQTPSESNNIGLNIYCDGTHLDTIVAAFCQGNRKIFIGQNNCGNWPTSDISISQTTGAKWESPLYPFRRTSPTKVAIGAVNSEEFSATIPDPWTVLWTFEYPPTTLDETGTTVVTPNLPGTLFVSTALTFNFTGISLPAVTTVHITGGATAAYNSPALDTTIPNITCNGTIVSTPSGGVHATGTTSVSVSTVTPVNFGDIYTVSGFILVRWVAD